LGWRRVVDPPVIAINIVTPEMEIELFVLVVPAKRFSLLIGLVLVAVGFLVQVQAAGAAFTREFQLIFLPVVAVDTLASAAASGVVLSGRRIAGGGDVPSGDESDRREENESCVFEKHGGELVLTGVRSVVIQNKIVDEE